MEYKYFITILAIIVEIAYCDNVGWKGCFTENSEEFHNLLLNWEKGNTTNVPHWLTGVYVRNGPAQVHNIEHQPIAYLHKNINKVFVFILTITKVIFTIKISFGSEKRHLTNWLDGFAKLHTLKFDGQNVYFSGKMIESTTYLDSVKKQELVPQFTLSSFANPDDEWSIFENIEMMKRANEQFNGNMEHNMARKNLKKSH